ncbi:MAG: sulfatase-like hydrolase/transferase [Candidatus Amulumruptor caecigallinarius]|nr:sulfatase-like hydrolase/transferase [Candidatus Amulumruptor caecigallinarius]MCM1397615.1 sulfatase-like hydrolase/transferase [Candidatus Amulumruptor caecigallinarius]
MGLNPSVFSSMDTADYIAVMAHGLRLDMAVAAYLTAIPTILTVIWLWKPVKALRIIINIYLILVAAAVGVILTMNSVLYSFWRFPLDMTPVFYFTTSPEAASASVSWLYITGVVIIIAVVSAAVYVIERGAWKMPVKPPTSRKSRLRLTAGCVVISGVLFLFMRGGFTVATLNPGAAYFSDRQPLNHAAINPAFNLLYSATHQNKLGTLGRYMDEQSAADIFVRTREYHHEGCDSIMVVNDLRPDIYLIIWESLSNQLVPSLGGEPIATHLDSIAKGGLSWRNFYANGFRTDRGIPAIISAIPSPPAVSVMKLSDVMEDRQSIASVLRHAGYDTYYYYGGDINFTNMNAYLVSAHFNHIISDRNFPLGQRLSKWGVHDGPLADRVASELPQTEYEAPRLTVIQTSSSHEPFDVPVSFVRFANQPPAVNAFAYTDSVVASLVKRIEESPRGRKSLIVITGDHWGCYPENLMDPDARHRIPLVVTGGALLRRGETLDAYGSQVDIAPTVLHWLGLPANSFTFGRVLTHEDTPLYAFWFDSDRAAVINADGMAIINVDNGDVVAESGDPSLATTLRAYLQTLYDSLSH